MSRSGKQARIANRTAGKSAFRTLGLSLAFLLLGSCTYEPAVLQLACCVGGIQLEVQLEDEAQDVAIVWSGSLEYEFPPPVGTDLDTDATYLDRSFNEECPEVDVDDYLAVCAPRDGLRAGGWTLQISVYREDSIGNLESIAGSPFTCQVAVPSMVDAEGRQHAERRTRLLITEGGEARDGCIPTYIPRRTDKTPIALYDFEEGDGSTVTNRMGDSSLDLTLQRGPNLNWQPGYLDVSAPTLLATVGPANAITNALQATDQLTIEAWVRPAEPVPTQASGSLARIVSLSADPFQRNVTLGQEADHFALRLRRVSNPQTGDERNGLEPVETSAGSVATQLTHLVATYDAAGNMVIYINGIESGKLQDAGDFSAWGSYRLAMGNEVDEANLGPRAWLGQYHLVAIYAEALTPREIEEHALVGPYAEP